MKSLNKTITLTILLVSIFLISLIGGMNLYKTYSDNKQIIAAEQEALVKDAINKVRDHIKEKVSMLAAVIYVSDVINVTNDNREQEIILARALAQNEDVSQIVLLDSKGKEIGRQSRLETRNLGQITDERKKEIFKNEKTKETYISKLYIDENVNEPVVIISIISRDRFGDFNGMMLAELSMKSMWELISSMKVGKNGIAYVVDSQGILLAYKDNKRVLKKENLKHLSVVENFTKNNNNDYEIRPDIVKGINGNDVVSSLMPVGYTDWAVAIEIPSDEAYAPLIKSMYIVVIIILICLVMSIIAGFLLSRRITRPIIKLRDAAVEISKGKLDTKIDIDSNNEIGDLADSFNLMIENTGNLIRKIKDVSNILLNHSSELKKYTDLSALSTDLIVSAIENITQGTQEQAKEVETTSMRTADLGNEIDQVVEEAMAVAEITDITKKLSTKSSGIVNILIEKARETDKITKLFTENITKLGDSIEKIRGITGLTTMLTRKVSLLALNATIEAAKSEEKGFEIIARDMGTLVGQSKETTNMIEPILSAIQQEMDSSLAISKKAYEVVEEQMKAVYSVQNSFADISYSMDNIVEKINLMNRKINSIENIKVSTISSVMSISSITEETAASSEEICASTQEQKMRSDTIKKFADELIKLGEGLVKNIEMFKV